MNEMAAARIDPESGIEHRLEYVPTTRGKLYTSMTRPQGSSTCVLICSSVLGDFESNYPRERSLSRALAERGLAVARFHYTGEGNSEGHRRDLTFSSMCDNARAVAAWATSQGLTNFALLGTRLGALVAARTLSLFPSAPVALWEPILEPLRFLVQGQRAKRMSQIAQESDPTSSDWQQELYRDGVLDLLGYDVYPALVESLEGLNLLHIMNADTRSVFIGRFRHNATPDPLATKLRDGGFSVDVFSDSLPESWWFPSEQIIPSDTLISATADWFVARVLNSVYD